MLIMIGRAWLVFLGVTVLVVPAVGQNRGGMEEIIVTTRKRAENIQDVPIAITPITAATIERNGINGLEDITRLSSSLSFDESFSQQDIRLTMRGLSNTRGRSNVAFLIDGVDVTTESLNNPGASLLANQRLLRDMQRVEIVKGPQSALYGRAAFAGAISYVTKDASEELEGDVRLELAEDGIYEASGSVSGPLTDELGVRLTGVAWGNDGRYSNVVSGEDTGGGDGYGVALTTNWNPSETFSAKLRLSWSDDEYDIRSMARIPEVVTLPVPQNAVDAGVTAITEVDLPINYGTADDRFVAASENPRTGGEYPGVDVEIFRATLNLLWETDFGTITSYTGFADADTLNYFDSDRSALNRPDEFLGHFETNDLETNDQFSQELRYATDLDGPLNFTLGGLYWEDDREQDAGGSIIVCLANFAAAACPDGWQGIHAQMNPQYGQNGIYDAETTHWSVYGLAEWDITDQWRFTAEARYIDEEFDLLRSVTTGCLALVPFTPIECSDLNNVEGSEDSDFWTPKFTLEWRPTDNDLIYFSVGKGQKPGGISVQATGSPTALDLEELRFDSEKMWSYELGTKSGWSFQNGGDLILDTALFYQDYTDKQTFTQDARPDGALVPIISNASSAEVWGLEISTTWQTPLDGLLLSLAYTWLDTDYDDFVQTTSSSTRLAIAGTCEVVTPEGSNRNTCVIDLTGNELERSPEHSLVAQGSFTAPLLDTGMEWFIDGDVKYTDERFIDQDNWTFFDDFWMLNLRLGLQTDTWDALLFVDNLTDEDTINTGGIGPEFGQRVAEEGFLALGQNFYQGRLPDPRTFGLRASYRF